MDKLVFCWRRVPELSREEAQRYWREQHAPLVTRLASTLGITRYVQVHTTPDAESYGGRSARSAPEPYDGVAELWFDADAATGSAEERRAAVQALLEDERHFIDHARSPLWIGEERSIIEP